jgi:UDPglucose--hexose-1-phosphate uridylyltransferase
MKKTNTPSFADDYPQLRFHPTLKEWVVIAPRRSLRHHASQLGARPARVRAPKKTCPFENPQAAGNADPYFWFPSGAPLAQWTLQAMPNKYSALSLSQSFSRRSVPPFSVVAGRGFHDLVITRDHDANFSDLPVPRAADVIKAFVKRYRDMARVRDIAYVSIFQNWGPTAGASVYHPHYQMIALPVVPTDVARSLAASKTYRAARGQCIHCAYIADAKKSGRRVIYEDARLIAFAPFASMRPFEIALFPKKHSAYFEDMNDAQCVAVAAALQAVLKKLKRALHDPDYNFFIHTAPIANKRAHGHYHWHIEIVPHTHIDAGFELGTGIEINSVPPEDAARLVRGDSRRGL